ncbi:MAG: hypothetical protein M3R29_02890 [Verrucomicrobiota bacterium]|nr:hypothetical protein [Verrucomicrobiota bacterium]
MKNTSSHKQTGSSLIVVMSILATLMVIVGIAVEYTTNINRNVQRSGTLGAAIAVGDSCIDILFANWRNTCRTNPTSALATSAFSSIALPTSAMFPSLATTLPNFSFGATATDYYTNNTANPPTISNFKVVAANSEWQPISGSSAVPIPLMGLVDKDITTLAKTTPAVFNYVASADMTLPALKGNLVAKVRRVFQKQQLSPWNFAIFYVDPLEIHPGPLFTVTGWVHTNADLYTAHNTLTFADKVTYASDWFINFKPGDGQHNADTPASPNYLSNLPPARDVALQPFGMDSTSIFNTTDANPNNDSYREIIEPPTSAGDPLSASRYWDQADIVIQISDTPSPNTVKIGTPNSNGTINVLSSGSLYSMFSGAITTGQTIQDNREGASMRFVTLDINQILNNTSGLSPTFKSSSFTKGIIYIYDTTNSSSTRRAVRIKNGSKIPSTGLTIASNNAVYIQGDFNTGGAGATVPTNNPANLNANGTYIDPANPPNPNVSGYTRAPCSILADAVNILSSSWNDANAGTVPAASPTTVNTAVIAGIVPTAAVGGDGSYSGGAENFPRFLENWSTKTLTYYGSMVELYKSGQSIGEWGKANVYSPPAREWFFDTNFRTTPPPGSIMIYSYIKGKWSIL